VDTSGAKIAAEAKRFVQNSRRSLRASRREGWLTMHTERGGCEEGAGGEREAGHEGFEESNGPDVLCQGYAKNGGDTDGKRSYVDVLRVCEKESQDVEGIVVPMPALQLKVTWGRVG